MKNKRIFTILIIFLILVPFIATYLLSNFNVDFRYPQDKGTNTIEFTEIIDNNEKIFSADLQEQYINKLEVNFDSENVVDFKVIIDGKNVFGREEVKEQNVYTDIAPYTLYINRVANKIEIQTNLDSSININAIRVINETGFNMYYFAFFTSVSFVIGAILFLYKSKYFKLEYAFLILIVTLGFNMILSMPKVSHWSPDSEIHFRNSYEASFLRVAGYTEGYYESIKVPPISMLQTKESQSVLNNRLNSTATDEFVNTTDKGSILRYNKWAYIPSMLGIKIGRALHLPFTWMYALGKVFNLVFYAIMCFFAIKLSQHGKRLVFALSLIPIMLFLGTQYSLDGVIFSSILLGGTLFINQYLDKTKQVTFGWTIAFLASMSFGIFAKAVYAPLILAPLLFDKEKFKTKKHARWYKFGIVMTFILLLSIMILPMLSSSAPGDLRGGYTSATGQLYSLLTHPIAFVQMFSNILVDSFGSRIFNVETFTGPYYLPLIKSTYGMLLLLTCVVLGIIDWKIDQEIKLKHKVFMSVTLCCLILMIFGALYLSYTPVGLSVVNGVQVRYFAPLLLGILFLFANNKIKVKFDDKKFDLTIICISGFVSFSYVYYSILLTFCR